MSAEIKIPCAYKPTLDCLERCSLRRLAEESHNERGFMLSTSNPDQAITSSMFQKIFSDPREMAMYIVSRIRWGLKGIASISDCQQFRDLQQTS